MAEQKAKKTRKKRITKKQVATKSKQRDSEPDELPKIKSNVARFKLRCTKRPDDPSTDITDVMPLGMIMAIDALGDITVADGYFLGAMASKMVNCLSSVEREHLENLLKPLIDKLHKETL